MIILLRLNCSLLQMMILVGFPHCQMVHILKDSSADLKGSKLTFQLASVEKPRITFPGSFGSRFFNGLCLCHTIKVNRLICFCGVWLSFLLNINIYTVYFYDNCYLGIRHLKFHFKVYLRGNKCTKKPEKPKVMSL